MLEIIKQVLIMEKQLELNQKEKINQEMSLIRQEEIKNSELFDQKLKQIENEIKELDSSLWNRIFKNKKIKTLYTSYLDLSHKKSEKIKELNIERDQLLKKLYELTHNEALVEMEIERIKKAHTLEELGITEIQALNKIKDSFGKNDEEIVKSVFLNIKSNSDNPLESREDIFRNMQMLYQTNKSPFVLAMRKVLPSNLVSELVDIGIIIEDDKIELLNKLTAYTLSPSHNKLPILDKLHENDSLDNYYYCEIEKAISNIEGSSSYSIDTMSKIITLTVLVSIAKANNLKKTNQK